MINFELHSILDNKDRRISFAELKQLIYEMKQDVLREIANSKVSISETQFYQGEQNAFQIMLDLMKHCHDNT